MFAGSIILIVSLLIAEILYFFQHIAAPIGWVALFFKMIASTAFLATAWAAGARKSPYGKFIFYGLFFSWFGDLFLHWTTEGMFVAGLIAFLLGHLMYCVAYLYQGATSKKTGIGLLIIGLPVIGILVWLWPSLGPDDPKIPVAIYMIIITAMMALAIGTQGRPGWALIVIGAGLFYVSDIFVARGAFVSPGPENRPIAHTLYYIGQLILALSIAPANRMWVDDD